MAWSILWLAAVAMWAWVLAGIDDGTGSDLVSSVGFGVLIATPCVAAWQAVAYLARHFWASDLS